MTPRWLTIETLVGELGSVCSSRHEVDARTKKEAVEDIMVIDTAVDQATRAVTILLRDPSEHDDVVVRDAWMAIATAQDAIAHLRATIERSRALRDRAQDLQDGSLRGRRDREAARHDDGRLRPARWKTSRD